MRATSRVQVNALVMALAILSLIFVNDSAFAASNDSMRDGSSPKPSWTSRTPWTCRTSSGNSGIWAESALTSAYPVALCGYLLSSESVDREGSDWSAWSYWQYAYDKPRNIYRLCQPTPTQPTTATTRSATRPKGTPGSGTAPQVSSYRRLIIKKLTEPCYSDVQRLNATPLGFKTTYRHLRTITVKLASLMDRIDKGQRIVSNHLSCRTPTSTPPPFTSLGMAIPTAIATRTIWEPSSIWRPILRLKQDDKHLRNELETMEPEQQFCDPRGPLRRARPYPRMSQPGSQRLILTFGYDDEHLRHRLQTVGLEQKCVHCDVKPDNILELKLEDRTFALETEAVGRLVGAVEFGILCSSLLRRHCSTTFGYYAARSDLVGINMPGLDGIEKLIPTSCSRKR